MPAYNGHRSWAAWNVSLWINNDEPLYRLALDCIKRTSSREAAARAFLAQAPTNTPDGARYTVTTVREAMRGL